MAAITKAELAAQVRRLQKSLGRAKAKNAAFGKSLAEALEQQSATSEILRVISGSPTDVQPVLNAVAESAARLCDASDAFVLRRDGDVLRYAAHYGDIPSLSLGSTLPVARGLVIGRAILEGKQFHIRNLQAETKRFPEGSAIAREHGYRTSLTTPLMREGNAIGVVVVRRIKARPFTKSQVALVKTFADQAAIAIENARLFKELQGKNNALAESLEQQTATSEILRVISSSPGDLEPTFQTILASATRLCEAHLGLLYRYDGNVWTAVAFHGASPAFVSFLSKGPIEAGPKTALARLIVERRPIHIPNIVADAAYEERDPLRVAQAELGQARTLVAVPMAKEKQLLGAIVIYRPEVRPFTERQIGLVRTFADQAAIAIENVRLFNETKEALERQTATAEILNVISNSPTDVQPVFEAIVKSTEQLFSGCNAALVMREGDLIHLRALGTFWGSATGREEIMKIYPVRFDPERYITARTMVERRVIQVPDTEAPGVLPIVTQVARAGAYRSVTLVPLMREGEGIGVIVLVHREPGFRLNDKQLALVQTFTAQAVIAIENVRLFNETKEALERQTATAEILKVISSSPTQVQPVFEAIADSSMRLLGGWSVHVCTFDGERLHFGAARGALPDTEQYVRRRYPAPPNPDWMTGRCIIGRSAINISDCQADPSPAQREFARQRGYRAGLAVPMLLHGQPIGAIAVTREKVGAFAQAELDMLQTFADQAVIAIENVRLFSETSEALERQTATAEILKVIASSPSDVQPVFDIISRNALKLCGSLYAIVQRFDGELMHFASSHHIAPEQVEIVARGYPRPADNSRAGGRAILSKSVVRIEDTLADPQYDSPATVSGGWRRILAVPMLREGHPLGAIVVGWAEPGPIPKVQEDLLKTFADQAVIAIENVRLFKELEARTAALSRSVGQLTALGAVGQAISSSLDLETVLRTIVSRALQLTGLDAGEIFEYDDRTGEFHLWAAENLPGEIVEALRRTPMRKGEGAVGRTAVTGEPTEIPEILDASYQSRVRELLVASGLRALLAVPLLREDRIIGAIVVNRKTPGPFAPETVELLKTFATQSALAIQNARLFREIAQKGRQLEVASRHKSDFLASMSHELRTPLNAMLGFNEMLLGEVYGAVPPDMKEPLGDIQTSGKHLLRLINNVLDLAKIEAGRMELALADYSVQDTVESVRASLRPLAADKGLEFAVSVPNDIPLAYGDAGRITQCLMNLAGNSLKFTKAGKVEISVELKDGLLTYRVSDTGIGIPPDKIGNLFTEFKQTDATIASEYGGTGLGLSITKKFIEMHGGRIWVESDVGKGSRFIFEIPLRAGEKTAAGEQG